MLDRLWLCFCVSASPGLFSGGGDPPAPAFDVLGLELAVPDVAGAARFYEEAFGFAPVEACSSASVACLELGGVRLFLRASEAGPARADSAGFSLGLEVRDLASALERALAAGASVDDPAPRTLPIGRAIDVRDPAGQRVHLIDAADQDPDGAIGVYCLGVDATGWEVEAGFLALGFAATTRAYLPLALPLEQHGSAQLVLHAAAGAPVDPGARGASLVLATADLEPARAFLAARGLLRADAAPHLTAAGRALAFRGPSGLALRVLERSSAALAFERLKSLAGLWEGKSSEGWTSRTRYAAIAGGTVLLETEDYEAHRGDPMATVFHLDGPALGLTHYCVAGNQPHLVASELAPERVVFDFAGGANLASRDQGHMDRAVFEFHGPDAFTSTWSWYQDGQPGWSETIEYHRLAEPAAAAAVPAACCPGSAAAAARD